MKFYLISSLSLITVILFLVLKTTGQLRLNEMNPLLVAGIRVVLFVVVSAFFGLLTAKAIHTLIGYAPTPISIALYGAGILLTLFFSWHSVRWLTRVELEP